MRRFLFVAMASMALVTVVAHLVRVTPVGATVRAAPVLQRGEESPCVAERNKEANPKVLLLGERTKLTLKVTALCAGETFPLHIVLVLDASGSMAGSPTKQMKEAAIKMVRDLDLRENPGTEVGVVQFNSQAQTLTQLTNSDGRVISAIRRVGAAGGTRIDEGIKEGMKVLLRGRSGGPVGSDEHEVMVVLSDGGNNAGCPPVLQAAAQAKGQGILVITVCVGAGCDAQCMRQAASSPRYFFEVQNAGQLLEVFNRIRALVRNITLRQLTVKDTLPDNMRYVPGSADPEPKEVSANGDVLLWQTNYVPQDGMTYTFKVEPLDPGYHPTNLEASGTFKDNQNREGSFIFQIPWVTVLKADPIATPTDIPPTPTWTPTPTLGPSPTPSATPTATPTPRPKPIYLPILIWHPCEIDWYRSDVALVLDISTSMNRPTRSGRTKLAATLDQAKQFVAQMAFEPDAKGRHDQVAVVGFNHSAWIQQSLTRDRAAILRAIDDLPAGQRQYTRLDLAIERGAEALRAANHRPENTKVIILVTDGFPNQVPYAEDGTMETTVLRLATEAKLAGARVYTIAIGSPDDTNPELLKAVASNESLYYYEPDPEDLGRVYSEIVGSIGCPKTRFEWESPWPDSP